jgi:hypothetical protein
MLKFEQYITVLGSVNKEGIGLGKYQFRNYETGRCLRGIATP